MVISILPHNQQMGVLGAQREVRELEFVCTLAEFDASVPLAVHPPVSMAHAVRTVVLDCVIMQHCLVTNLQDGFARGPEVEGVAAVMWRNELSGVLGYDSWGHAVMLHPAMVKRIRVFRPVY
jgi:hypothetical protein